MRLSLSRFALVAGLVVLAGGSARAQNDSPQQLQALISSGQEQQALHQLSNVIKLHPDSGVAWYLVAEAEDAAGNESTARRALAKAQQLAPGLPFAQPDQVAALQSHLADQSAAGATAPLAAPAPAASPAGSGISPLALGIGAIVVLFIVVRMFLRSRRRSMMPAGYRGGYGPNGPPPNAPMPYGPGGMPYGGGGMMGGTGSSLLGGLAAGAGFAAGERILGNLTGGGGLSGDANPNAGLNEPAPERDDGLNGNPNWDDGNAGGGGVDPSNNDGFDPGNNW